MSAELGSLDRRKLCYTILAYLYLRLSQDVSQWTEMFTQKRYSEAI